MIDSIVCRQYLEAPRPLHITESDCCQADQAQYIWWLLCLDLHCFISADERSSFLASVSKSSLVLSDSMEITMSENITVTQDKQQLVSYLLLLHIGSMF